VDNHTTTPLEMLRVAALLLAAALCSSVTNAQLQCVGDDGKPVDWFVLIKRPGMLGYVYADNRRAAFSVSARSMGSTTSGAFANTLNAAFRHNYAVFNSHVPAGGRYQRGSLFSHGAGFIGVDNNTATGECVCVCVCVCVGAPLVLALAPHCTLWGMCLNEE
jgi:hypothetical protein